MGKFRVAFGYNAWNAQAIDYHEKIVTAGQNMGIDVFSVVVTPTPPQPHMDFFELHKKVSQHNREIVKFRDHIIEQIKEADIFWLFNGANFHPSWISLLPEKQLKIYGFHDAPESSASVSLAVAPYFDACLISNISAIPLYQGYAKRKTEWLPLFVKNTPVLSDEDFAGINRPYGLVFCGERQSTWRKERLDYLQRHFPSGIFCGRGWENGFIPSICDVYKKSKIGINIHNSTGPINVRLNELPAYGVMQVCDNKCRLGHIYQLNNEVIGYDYMDEAIDLIKYYLDPAHEEERAQIAWNGYQRYKNCYTLEKIWSRAQEKFERLYIEKQAGKIDTPSYKKPSKLKQFQSSALVIKNSIHAIAKSSKQIARVFLDRVAPCPSIVLEHDACISISRKDKLISPLQFLNTNSSLNKIENKLSNSDDRIEEMPEQLALSWAVAGLVGSAKRILEINSGLGSFAFDAAQDPSRTVLALDNDSQKQAWAIKNRMMPNITYTAKPLSELNCKFDLIVWIDTIQDTFDYQSVLSETVRLAPKAIFTTPNRLSNFCQNLFDKHDHKWGPEGFYYMLRAYYKKVYLLSMPDIYIPLVKPVDINATTTPLIAICENEL